MWDTCPLTRPRKVEGVLPDWHRFGPLRLSFGHVSTLPQLLAGAGVLAALPSTRS